MLKFAFVPHLLTKDLVDEKTRASNPEFWDQPYRFVVKKETTQGYPADICYDADEGAIRLLFDTVRPGDRLIDPKDFYKVDDCDEDAVGESYEYFEGCLFYYNTEYTLDFLNGRFAQDLNEIMNAFTEFEQGAIWSYLYFLNRQIAKYLTQPVLNEKNLHKFASSVYNQIHILDYSTGVISKMIKYVHDEYTNPVKCIPAVYRPNEPPRVPTDIYVPGRVFILFSYLTIYPIKEHVVGQNCIWTDKYDIRAFLYDCLGHSIGYIKDRYKAMYKEPEFNKIDLLVKSPGRLLYNKKTNEENQNDTAIYENIEKEVKVDKGSDHVVKHCRILKGGKLRVGTYGRIEDIHVEYGGELVLHDCSMAENVVVHDGGSIYIFDRVILKNVRVCHNGVVFTDTRNVKDLILANGVLINPDPDFRKRYKETFIDPKHEELEGADPLNPLDLGGIPDCDKTPQTPPKENTSVIDEAKSQGYLKTVAQRSTKVLEDLAKM